MKLGLRVCGDSVDDIKKVLKLLSSDDYKFESNEMATMGLKPWYDYEFVDSVDVFSEDKDRPTINPYDHEINR